MSWCTKDDILVRRSGTGNCLIIKRGTRLNEVSNCRVNDALASRTRRGNRDLRMPSFFGSPYRLELVL